MARVMVKIKVRVTVRVRVRIKVKLRVRNRDRDRLRSRSKVKVRVLHTSTPPRTSRVSSYAVTILSQKKPLHITNVFGHACGNVLHRPRFLLKSKIILSKYNCIKI